MKMTINFPLYGGCLSGFGTMAGLKTACAELGCSGIEAIWGDDAYCGQLPQDGLTVGYHLAFWPDWVDFWHGDERALLRKFGNRAAYSSFYGAESREGMVKQYLADMERAALLGAEYVVFHVSDVSIEESYTYQWEHTDEEVIDAACELLNLLTDGRKWPFSILVENQWWPGFKFTDPRLTERLMNGLSFPDKGIMLDTGHLINTDPELKNEAEGIAYIHEMLDRHGELAEHIRGIHLNKSLSGEYVKSHTGIPCTLADGDYIERFGKNYSHILKIDRHEPWTEPLIAEVVERIDPKWLTHELAAGSVEQRILLAKVQIETLRKGGLVI